jgi:2-polyprenyl-3-methyl-5-hydroxy-6-metoxy-1,4-benzoquinol methylase
MHATARLLLAILLVAVTLSTVNQVRKPTKWIGRFVLWMMNFSHSSLTDWGLTHVRIEGHFTILDVGCGGGRTIQKLAATATKGMIYGVDYAEGSVIASRAKNARSIQSGQVEVRQASVSRLPFPEGQFDLVTAVETQYYWPSMRRPVDVKSYCG